MTHVDTVCVISLGLLVDRGGFTFNWQPGKAPTLTKGKTRVTSQPSFNVPFIYTSKYLDARKASLTLTKTNDPARGNPFALPSTSKDDDLCFDQILGEEMKGAEDLIPPLAADAGDPHADMPRMLDSSESETEGTPPPKKLEGTPKRKQRSCP